MRDLNEAVERRERELGILAEVASRVHGEDSVQRIFDIALEEILGRMGLTAAWIFTGESGARMLRLSAWRGVSEAYLEQVRVSGLGECLCPEVFWTGHRMQARNTTQCPRMPHIVAGLRAPVAHACIPLKFEGATKGVLNVAARPGEQFSEEELRFLETLGHQIGLAVERARHREAEQARNAEARAMAAISKAIGGTLDASAILRAVGVTAHELLGVDRVRIFLGSDPRRMAVAHLSGPSDPELTVGQQIDLVALGARLQTQAIEEGRAFHVDDCPTDPRVQPGLAQRWGAASALIVPLLARGRTLGLLVLTRPTIHQWSREQVDLAEGLAAQAAVALENARLYEDARTAYRELKEAQQRIIQSEKMAVLGTFASGLAHEVRNPLNSIGLQMSVLERRIARLEGALSREMGGVASIIRQEIRRLDGLVGDFLLFSRADRVSHETADLDELVDHVLRLMEPEAAAAGVRLTRRPAAAPLPPLAMDVEKMKQVVINLARNAVEAMPGGGTVTVETGIADGRVRLAVQDTGPGLPEGLDVFQLFVTTKPQGTGLGLSIVQQIVMQHGGEVTAANAPGGGACFTVSLPLTGAGGREGARG